MAGEGDLNLIRLLEPPPRSLSPGLFQLFPDRIKFSWPEVNKAVLYHIEVSTGERFTILVVDAETANNYLIVNRLPEEIYFWRISCIDAKGLEGKFSQNFIYYCRIN